MARPRIEQREGDAAHQPQLLVAEVELGLDRHREDADDLPVDEVEDVGEEQDEEDAPAGARPLAPAPAPHQRKLNPKLRKTWRGLP